MPTKTQGNERYTETYKNNREGTEKPVMDAAREYGPGVVQEGGDTMDLTFSAGRTISLGNYEFVRIQIGARGGFVPVPNAEYDAGYDKLKAFVSEILAREEAMVRKSQRKPEELPALEGTNRVVWVEYGLTINAAVKMESHKIDIGLSRPIGDDEDAASAVDALETYLAQRISAERDRLRGAA